MSSSTEDGKQKRKKKSSKKGKGRGTKLKHPDRWSFKIPDEYDWLNEAIPKERKHSNRPSNNNVIIHALAEQLKRHKPKE